MAGEETTQSRMLPSRSSCVAWSTLVLCTVLLFAAMLQLVNYCVHSSTVQFTCCRHHHHHLQHHTTTSSTAVEFSQGRRFPSNVGANVLPGIASFAVFVACHCCTHFFGPTEMIFCAGTWRDVIWYDRLQKFLASRDIDDAYDIGAVLGRGAYSVVKTAKSKKTNDEVNVLKILQPYCAITCLNS